MSLPIQPESFLEVRVHDLGHIPTLTGLCVGYERGSWRDNQFVDHVMEWIPEFALNHTETANYHSGNGIRRVRHAAKRVYETEKFKNRGEFGELFLHAAIRQVFGSLPAISKIYYKSAINDTYKGFDAVHVVEVADGLELWLGEAKFYNGISRAIRDVVSELRAHTETDYLRTEFLLIKGKIDPSWPYANDLEELLKDKKSLDEVFKRIAIPVLLTYNSDCVTVNDSVCDTYTDAFEAEIRKHYATFVAQDLPKEVVIHLILLPLKSKRDLVKLLDQRLKAWQKI